MSLNDMESRFDLCLNGRCSARLCYRRWFSWLLPVHRISPPSTRLHNATHWLSQRHHCHGCLMINVCFDVSFPEIPRKNHFFWWLLQTAAPTTCAQLRIKNAAWCMWRCPGAWLQHWVRTVSMPVGCHAWLFHTQPINWWIKLTKVSQKLSLVTSCDENSPSLHWVVGSSPSTSSATSIILVLEAMSAALFNLHGFLFILSGAGLAQVSCSPWSSGIIICFCALVVFLLVADFGHGECCSLVLHRLC